MINPTTAAAWERYRLDIPTTEHTNPTIQQNADPPKKANIVASHGCRSRWSIISVIRCWISA